jgi:acetyl-CoA carboxylase carboxyltransferase component
LCDADSLRPLTPPSADVSVQAARGSIAGRPVVCYAQDARMAGGSVGVGEAEVITLALRYGGQVGVPVVGFLESGGARLQEGAAALAGFGRIFFENVALSGRSPQISVITGMAAGGGCYSPALTDFVVMVEHASMFLTGPRVVKHALGEEVSASELGGPHVHLRNGVCDFVVADDHEAAELITELLGYLPQNGSQRPPRRASRPPDSSDPGAWLPSSPRGYYDMRSMIGSLVDGGTFLEVGHRWARNMVVGFARLEGHVVGVVANQPRHMGGIIDIEGSQKGAKFIRTCDSFGIPLLVLVDTPGFMPGTRQERGGVIRHGASLVRAFAAATVPRVSVIVRKAYGGAFIAMNSKDLGADASFCWPDAEVGVMSAGAAVTIIHRREIAAAGEPASEAERLARRYSEANLSAGAAVARGAVDAVIEPRDTRACVADVLLGVGRRNAVTPV